MSDYPPGSFGYELDRLENELRELSCTGGWTTRLRARRKLKQVQAKREAWRRRIPTQLERAGAITSEQRKAMEEL